MARKRTKRKLPTITSLKRKAWRLLSKAIRLEAQEPGGWVQCVTCGVHLPSDRMQAGHFIDGRANAILFDERGIHPQCYACNVIYNGRKDEYWVFMERRHGRGVIDELMAAKSVAREFSRDELLELIDQYTGRIDAICRPAKNAEQK